MTVRINQELYSSKNSRQIFRSKQGRSFVAKSNAALKHETDLKCELLSKIDEFIKEKQGLTPPYKIEFKIHRKRKGRFDYINIIQQLCDCMVSAGIIPDDCSEILIPVFSPVEYVKNNPYVEITFLR